MIRWLRQRLGVKKHSPQGSATSDLVFKSVDDDHPFRKALGTSTFVGWLREQAEMPRTFVSSGPGLLPQHEVEPERARCLAAAERLMSHEFDLLGSGPFRPDDPDRPARGSYQPIDWTLDPVRKLRFPRGFHYKDWDLMRDRPGDADVKFPWELARCQHFLTLAQAWHVSGEERFASEILNQMRDFDEVNPVEFGVNWTCTMDVSIRAANWAVALDLIKSSGLADMEFAYACLFEHGEFIRANLENHYEVTSNHYLSNIVGLHFVAAVFQDTDAGRSWLTFCEESIPVELDVQILSDGADFESAIPYHRLVCELFLASYRLGQHLGRPFDEYYRSRLMDMLDYAAGTLRPDGRMPVLGDCDDGRFIIAGDIHDWDRQDLRHLFWPAALSLDCDRWLQLGADDARWEALWWGQGSQTLVPPCFVLPANQKLYPEAGIAISRMGGQYLMVSNSIVGTVGFGNHKHNEQLSFEYHDLGFPLIVDPGSFVYTGDFDGRNLFRSTRYHNTAMVDGVEQNEFNPEWLFRMFEKANPVHCDFDIDGATVRYVGRHTGYVDQLEQGLTHKRLFEHDAQSGLLRIEDEFAGEGEHEIEWNFMFDPAVNLALVEDAKISLSCKGNHWELNWDGVFDNCSVLDGFVSPSYGRRIPSRQLRLITRLNFDNPDTHTWSFSIFRA